MIKVEVIKEFTLKDFSKLNNIKRKMVEKEGKLYVGDTFECDEKMYNYLTGKNESGIVVVKVIELKPDENKTITARLCQAVEPKVEAKEVVKPNISKKKKSSKK